jgi:signal transduction histidine kinase
MSINVRFALLVGALLLAFLLGLLLLQRVERQEQEQAISTHRQERTQTLERLIELSGQNLRQLANDYSLWDDTVRFVRLPTEEWARINLDPALTTFDADAIWVLDPAGQTVWAITARGAPLPTPVPTSDLIALAERQPFAWFFAESPLGLMEVRLAPIQPSHDIGRELPPEGWFLAGRLWDEELLNYLGELTVSQASLTAFAQTVANPRSRDTLVITRTLWDWNQRPLRTLHLRREIPDVAYRQQADDYETRIFLGFGVLVMVLLGFALHSWVVRPLNAIRASLEQNHWGPIERLAREHNELGQVAQRVRESFAQRAVLEHEVQERRRVETALRESEGTLRAAMDERVRLGRDLHDSVIQSIYAAGMGLAAIRSLLPADPAESDRRLEQVRQTLNETIRDLRNFITGLEPEALERLSLLGAVRALIDRLQTSSPLQVQLEIDETVAEGLPPAVRADLLQIMREALSNVWRHASATSVQVALALDEEHAQLLVADDGCGFETGAVAGKGRGLVNMAERARAARATFEVATAVGKGTRLLVRFPVTFKVP